MFDAISGIGRSVADFATNFGGGIFSAVDERLRGGTLRTTSRAGVGRQLGVAAGNLFGDIGESFLSNRVRAGPAQPNVASPRPGGGLRRPGAGGQNVPTGGTGAGAIAGRGTFGSGRSAGIPGLGLVLPQEAGFPLPVPVAGGGGVLRGVLEGVAGTIAGELGFEAIQQLLGIGGQSMPTGGGAVALPGGAMVPQLRSGQANPIFTTFQNTATGAVTCRARSTFEVVNPCTGSTVFYRNMGRPLLWSGDLTAARRVRKAASKARRSRP